MISFTEESTYKSPKTSVECSLFRLKWKSQIVSYRLVEGRHLAAPVPGVVPPGVGPEAAHLPEAAVGRGGRAEHSIVHGEGQTVCQRSSHSDTDGIASQRQTLPVSRCQTVAVRPIN